MSEVLYACVCSLAQLKLYRQWFNLVIKKAISKDIQLEIAKDWVKTKHHSFPTNMLMFFRCVALCVWHPVLITKFLGEIIVQNIFERYSLKYFSILKYLVY